MLLGKKKKKTLQTNSQYKQKNETTKNEDGEQISFKHDNTMDIRTMPNSLRSTYILF